MANNKPTQCEGDLSHVNQVIELEAEKPRKILIEVKVKDVSLLEDEDSSTPLPNCSDSSLVTKIVHVWPGRDPEPDYISIAITDQSPPEGAGGSGLASLSETDETNASFKRLLSQWVPQNDERALRQHFYKYGPPPPVMPLPLAPPPSTESPIDRLTPDDEQDPEVSAISPENKCENDEEVSEASHVADVLELEKELIRSYNRLDPSKIKTFL